MLQISRHLMRHMRLSYSKGFRHEKVDFGPVCLSGFEAGHDERLMCHMRSSHSKGFRHKDVYFGPVCLSRFRASHDERLMCRMRSAYSKGFSHDLIQIEKTRIGFNTN